MKEMILLISLLGLFFTFNNVVTISALPSLMVLFTPFFIYKKYKINRMLFFLLLMMAYFFVNAFIYDWTSFLEYDFYRRDGNVFITFSPLIILLLFKYKINAERIFNTYIYAMTGINFVFLIIFYLTGGTIFFYEENVYHFLFEAHNAAGGFLMILSALSMGKFLKSRAKLDFCILFINLWSFYATNSRGSILALISASILFFFMKKGQEKKSIYIIVFSQILMYGWLYYNAPYNFLEVSLMTVEDVDSNFIDRGGTIINRGFYLWPRAIYLFLCSPIFGAGFGSFNDTPYALSGLCGFAYNNSKAVFDSAHAHNTFLNVAAETGIVGLILLFLFINECNKFIKKILDSHIFIGLYIALWSAVFSSLTEHRFFTPSQMIPLVILMGITHVGSYNKNNCD